MPRDNLAPRPAALPRAPAPQNLLARLERQVNAARAIGDYVRQARLDELVTMAGALKYKARLAAETATGQDAEIIKALLDVL